MVIRVKSKILKNKKGFTLVELLAVIVLLGLIVGISFPMITGIITNSKARTTEISISSIKKSAALYVKENANNVTWIDTVEKEQNFQYTCVSLNELITNGTLKKDAVDNIIGLYVTNDSVSNEEDKYNNVSVKVTRNINKSLVKEEIQEMGTCNTDINLNIIATTTKNSVDVNSSTCEYGKDKTKGILTSKLSTEDKYSSTNKFASLKPLTKYTVYVKCSDNAGNYLIKKQNFVTINYGTITINEDPQGCSPSKTITINKSSDLTNTSLQYSTDGKEWLDGDKFTLESNTIIYARYKDDNNKYRVITKSITTIDKSEPQVTITNIDTSIIHEVTVNYNITNKGTCGITKYEVKYQKSDGSEEEKTASNCSSTSCKITNLPGNTNYKFTVDVTNGNGLNNTKSQTATTKNDIFNLNYNNNNGSGCSTQKVTYGQAYGTLCTPTRTGYNFAGWYTAASGGTKVTADTKHLQESDITIYAHWTAKTFTLTYNNNGGSGCSNKTITYDSTYGSLCTPSRTSYNFAGWYTAASGGTKITPSTQVTVTSNQTLYAHWNIKTFTITYDNNGGSGCDSKSINYGATLSSLCTPSRGGYTFVGWYDSGYKGSPLNYYADTYSDLKNAFGYNQVSLYNHYLTYGHNEGRRVAQHITSDTYTINGNSTYYAGWVDNIAPSLSFSYSYGNSHTDYNGNTCYSSVTVTATCSDSGSGISNVAIQDNNGDTGSSAGTNARKVTMSGAGSSRSASATCTDNYGNSKSASTGGYRVCKSSASSVCGTTTVYGSWSDAKLYKSNVTSAVCTSWKNKSTDTVKYTCRNSGSAGVGSYNVHKSTRSKSTKNKTCYHY